MGDNGEGNKVKYCKNCEWYSPYHQECYFSDTHIIKEWSGSRGDYLKKKMKTISCDIHNKNNDCKYYTPNRRWWQIGYAKSKIREKQG